jgi:hypothetical protein
MEINGVLNELMVIGPFDEKTAQVSGRNILGKRIVTCHLCGFKAGTYDEVEKHWLDEHVDVPKGQKVIDCEVSAVQWGDAANTIEYVFLDYTFEPLAFGTWTKWKYNVNGEDLMKTIDRMCEAKGIENSAQNVKIQSSLNKNGETLFSVYWRQNK